MNITIYGKENAAFAEDMNGELVRIIRKIADAIENGETHGSAYDYNGNKVGTWSWDYVFDDGDDVIVEMTNLESGEVFVITVSKKETEK